MASNFKCHHLGFFVRRKLKRNRIRKDASQEWDVQRNPNFHFEGDALVVYTDTILPMYCINTGVPVTSHDMQQRRITCYPKPVWTQVLSLIDIQVPKSIFAKSCLVTYGMSPRVRKRYLRRQWASVVAMILAVIMLRYFVFLPFDVAFALCCLVFVSASLVLIFGSGFKLLDAEYQDGNFRVYGYSPLFRKALEEVSSR